MRLVIESRELAIQAYIDGIERANIDAELQSSLRLYGVVQVCGFLERCMEVIVLERLQARAHPRIIEFIKSHFKAGPNFRCTAIKSFLERFDVEWARRFQNFVDANDDVKEGIDSAYALRNQAAHGGTGSVGPQRLQELFDLTKRAVAAVVNSTN